MASLSTRATDECVSEKAPDLEVFANRLSTALDFAHTIGREIHNFLDRYQPQPELGSGAAGGPVAVPSGARGRIVETLDNIEASLDRANNLALRLRDIA